MNLPVAGFMAVLRERTRMEAKKADTQSHSKPAVATFVTFTYGGGVRAPVEERRQGPMGLTHHSSPNLGGEALLT